MPAPDLTRRKLLCGLGVSLLAAPAIVRVASLMPVRNRISSLPALPVYDVVRSSDGVVRTFGHADVDAMMRFLAGTTGKVCKVYDCMGSIWYART